MEVSQIEKFIRDLQNIHCKWLRKIKKYCQWSKFRSWKQPEEQFNIRNPFPLSGSLALAFMFQWYVHCGRATTSGLTDFWFETLQSWLRMIEGEWVCQKGIFSFQNCLERMGLVTVCLFIYPVMLIMKKSVCSARSLWIGRKLTDNLELFVFL